MKQKITGIISGVLLMGVLVGNLIISAISVPVAVPTGGAVKEDIAMPVLMYHFLLKEPARWGDYVISPDQFEKDLQQIQKEGYTAVSVRQVQDYLETGKALPEKPIMITFDDGYECVHEYAFPLLQKYNMCAVLSIIGKYTDLYSANPTGSISYSHVTWQQLDSMLSSSIFEIGNHTYDLHGSTKRKGLMKLSSESDEEYQALLENDVGALNREIKDELGVDPVIFSYPYGKYSDSSEQILKQLGFQVIFTCEEKVNLLNAEKHKQGGLIKLRRFNRPSGISSEQFFKKFT